LILEDEPLAVNVLKDYITEVKELELVAVCSTAMEAMQALRNCKVDLLFVDINLPKISGLDFIKTLKGDHKVILTTAYHEFALEGFNLNVTDYLLKPIEFSRFLQAVNKALNHHTKENIENKTGEPKFLFFNVDKKQVKVFLDEILYIESLKDYVKIVLPDRHVVTKCQLGQMEVILDKTLFMRCHKSFIINVGKVTSYTSTDIEIGKTILPIGRSFKERFYSCFGK
jgi:DNA-binding LytR/AlgR family response regulator